MSSDLQRIVDTLSARLDRAVALDDPRMHLLVHGPHVGPMDETRRASIMEREAPAASVEWARTLGIDRAKTPVRIPANPDLGLLPRVCIPARCQGMLLGFLVLMDADETLNDDDLEVAQTAADEAGLILYRERLLKEAERSQERELLRDLLSEEAQVRAQAAQSLVEAEWFASTRHAAIVTVLATNGNADESTRISLEIGIDQVRREITPRHILALARLDHGVLLVNYQAVGSRPQGLRRLAEQLRASVLERLAEERPSAAVAGIGSIVDDLTDAPRSYRRARLAARVAGIIPSYQWVAEWQHLGVYRLLEQLPPEEVSVEALHPGLLRLFEIDGPETLVHTLECYLDHAGDVKASAAELTVHRASLYYRLQRIEEITQASLRDGGDRLALHLGLKMAWLAGLHPLAKRV